MHSTASYTVERDIAAALRDVLFETALDHHDQSDSAESLAELAAGIDRELQQAAEAIELGVTARNQPAKMDDSSSRHNSTNGDRLPETAAQCDQAQERGAVHYRTAYECTICGDSRTVATWRQVCAFVDACPTCGAVARFRAAGSPTPYRT